MSAESRLAQVLEWLWSAPIPPEVTAKARLLLLDTLGCVLAASRKPKLQQLAGQLEKADPGPVRVPGFRQKLSVSGAASLFCTAACWDEACEGLARAHGRPGVPVIAACFSLAQVLGSSVDELLRAIVAGYETGGRMGEAVRIGPGMHVDAVWPGFGVAAGVVRLSGGTPAQALDGARCVASQMPQSRYLAAKLGAEIRNTYLSHSAQLGLLSANAALGGLTSPPGAVDELNPVPHAGPGLWVLLEGYLKPFAAVRHTHYGAQAAIGLRPRLAGRMEGITAIELTTYNEALTYCGNRAPTTPIGAQFSLTYALASALATGDVGPEVYSMDNAEILALERMVVLREDAETTRAGKRAATLRVTVGGETLEQRVDRVTGDPALPMTREEALAKFRRYAGVDGVRLLDAPGASRMDAFLAG